MKIKDYKKINKVEVYDYTKYPKFTIKIFTVSAKNTNVKTIQIDDEGILRVFVTPKHQKNLVCCSCEKPATIQTAGGKYQESIGALPQNFGWYCKKCYVKGLKEEEEAMYGN
jgi:hypothetical protein